MVPYVDEVVAVTVMGVLLFVLHVCLLLNMRHQYGNGRLMHTH